MRYRLIKPDWGKPDKIKGANIIEGDNFTDDFIREKNKLGYNIYYFPNYNSKKIEHPFLRGADIDVFTCCFVDMDLKDEVYTSCEQFIDRLMNDALKPNKIVLSGNGVHAYWNITDLTLENYLEIQLRLIQKYNTDTSIWTALQLMRLPKTYNTKAEDNYKFVEVLEVESKNYTVNDLKQLLPELTFENQRKIDMHIRKLNGMEELEILDVENLEIPVKFLELLQNSKKLQSLWGAEKGNRSEADFQIASILYDKDFSKKEALSVILNTSKALSKGVHRKSYAMNVVTSAYMQHSDFYVQSAAEKLANGLLTKNQRGSLVRSSIYFDCLEHGWRTSEVLGLIGSPGVGKTTATLELFYNMIKNNPEDDDIFIFFSLEMQDYLIIEQWQALTHDNPALAERFYVVSNEDDEGNGRYLNLQDIYAFVKDISKITGKKVKAIAIDHVGVINKVIDIKRKPDFGLAGRSDIGTGAMRTLTDREITKYVKSIAKELDVFIVLQSQTTKDKASEGDIPLGLGAAYGVAQFEWDMDYVITIWQPLKRVRNKTNLTVTAFQYCKNRYIHKNDKLKNFEQKVLFVDLDTGRFRGLTNDEFEEFNILVKESNALRKIAEKKEDCNYTNAADIDKIKAWVGGPKLYEIKSKV